MTASNDPDQIRADIDRTRSSLSANVDTLAYEAKPTTMAKRKVGRVSGAWGWLRERVMGSTQNTTSSVSGTAASAVSSVTDTAQSAPPRCVSRRRETHSPPDSWPSVPASSWPR